MTVILGQTIEIIQKEVNISDATLLTALAIIHCHVTTHANNNEIIAKADFRDESNTMLHKHLIARINLMTQESPSVY